MNFDKSILLRKTREWFELGERLSWKSYDPMDFLLSPYLERFQNISSYAARVLVQVGMRSGASIRRLLKIPPHEEAKTLSDYLSAAAILSKCQQPWAEAYLVQLNQRLKEKSIRTPNGWGWGLGFPYSTRFGSVSARTPNIYQTMNALHSFLDVYEVNRDDEALRYVFDGIQFILKDLGSFEYDGLTWFRYFPGRSHPVINIQASLASLLARCGLFINDCRLVEVSDQVANTVARTQLNDGSWFYSYDKKAGFIDGFHTGFILQGLSEYSNYRKNEQHSDVPRTIQKGLQFFLEHLISPEGLPRYYADGQVKLDGQNFAQCIQTLVLCSSSPDHVELAFYIWGKMVKQLQLDYSKYLASRTNTYHTYPQLRWTIGPAVLATAHLLRRVA